MSTLNPTKSLRPALASNNQLMQACFCLASPSATYKSASASGNTDPFTSKTNKYAESKIIEVVASGAIHLKFSSAGAAAAVTDYFLPANTARQFLIDSDNAYLRIIPNTGTPDVYVTEIY